MPRTIDDLATAEDQFHQSLSVLQLASDQLQTSEAQSRDASEKFTRDKATKQEALAATRAALAEVTSIVDELFGTGEESPAPETSVVDVRQ